MAETEELVRGRQRVVTLAQALEPAQVQVQAQVQAQTPEAVVLLMDHHKQGQRVVAPDLPLEQEVDQGQRAMVLD